MRKHKKDMILNEGMKRFQQILEYTYTAPMTEAGEDDEPDDMGQEQGGQMPPEGNGDMPDGPDQGQGMPPQEPPMDQGMPPQEPQMGQGMPPQGMDTQGGPEGFNPQDDAPMEPPMDANGADSMQPDDEVVDVSSLTDAQEDTEKKVDKLDSRFDKVIQAIGKFEELIRQNDEKLDKLKTEFEKRNPTQLEKLSMQTAKSYPFNLNPEGYWKDKEATSNYRVDGDDNGKEQGQYTITANDINGTSNWKEISDSMDDDDWMYNQTLKSILNV